MTYELQLNQGSFRISLADALVDGSNRSNFPIICPSLAISPFVKSSFRSPSKYMSSSHSCNAGPEISAAALSSIVFHKSCHLSGRASVAISRI
ncbi:hypothetical protein T310_9974 [Rasamsonia emersonii CBS 393.64]|uniref:Uncharacterized protein n=1 Tax=Rasamsonia emersonii (strain ATCC 16479 / CBS 393.64 / IMI 116815) TaxID=1408163 RepID=A0A0F4YEP4_RASE3|nr:hypothetical protein T310_9974 [Rasamsonia emersonii CBS 393.64]KKA16431.1 hypothetical protein T310_9974 [Rasamsonia emersonii CBS 393.64]